MKLRASSLPKRPVFDESVLLSAFFFFYSDYILLKTEVSVFFSSSTEFELCLVSVYNQ